MYCYSKHMIKMTRPKVYITRQIPQKGLEFLLSKCNVSFWDSQDPAPRAELLRNIRGVDVLLCMPTDTIDLQVLNTAGPQLKVVGTLSEDTDHIDIEACNRQNIQVVKMQKVSIDYISDLTLALLVTATGDWIDEKNGNVNTILQAKDLVHSIKSDKNYHTELSNRTAGIIGFGSLGLSLGRKLKQLGIDSIVYYDKEEIAMAKEICAKRVLLDDLFERCDIICVCSDIKSDNKKSLTFNKDTFRKMKSTAILIDATKGFHVDYSDLYEALRSGEIGAVGLDVREYDVIPNRHPLAGLENCHFLPYREFYKWDMRRNLSSELAKEVLQSLEPRQNEIAVN